MNRILLFCVLLLAATPHARADDTWHNIYHTLKRFFTGGEKHQTVTQRKHRRHLHTRPNSEKSSEPADSTEPRVIVLPEPTPAAGVNDGESADSKPSEPKPSPNSSPVLRSLP